MKILVNAPLWVWPVLLALIVLGVLQMRTTMVPRPRLLIAPFVLTTFSVVSVYASFQGHFVALAAWLCGALLSIALNLLVFQSPGQASFHVSTQTYEVPGSVIPLLLMLLIFSTRFVVGASKVMAPDLAASTAFEVVVCAVLGLVSGLLLARALVILRAPATLASTQ